MNAESPPPPAPGVSDQCWGGVGARAHTGDSDAVVFTEMDGHMANPQESDDDDDVVLDLQVTMPGQRDEEKVQMWEESELQDTLRSGDGEPASENQGEHEEAKNESDEESNVLPRRRRMASSHMPVQHFPKTPRRQFSESPLVVLIHCMAMDIVSRRRLTRSGLTSVLELLADSRLGCNCSAEDITNWFPRSAQDVIAYITARVPRVALSEFLHDEALFLHNLCVCRTYRCHAESQGELSGDEGVLLPDQAVAAEHVVCAIVLAGVEELEGAVQ